MNLINQITVVGTSTEMASGTRAVEYTFNVPFFYIAFIIAVIFLGLALFKLFFKGIWAE